MAIAEAQKISIDELNAKYLQSDAHKEFARIVNANMPAVYERNKHLVQNGVYDEKGNRLVSTVPFDMRDGSESNVSG